MREDNAEEFFQALANATESTLAMAPSRTFTEGAREYQKIAEAFVERAAGDEMLVLETHRRILEMTLREANIHEQPFEVCQEVWNELVRLGFSNPAVASTITWYYADCCLLNEKFDAGLAALEPMMTELQRLIGDPTMSRRVFYQDELVRLGKLCDELKASRRQ